MDPFVAEIRIFPFNFPPKGWAFCDGQLLPISQNTALFSLLGTTYGGNGKSNFALPNLQGNAPMHPGQGPGLSLHDLGETGGSTTVTLLESEMPLHSHAANSVSGNRVQGQVGTPGPTVLLAHAAGNTNAYTSGQTTTNQPMNPNMIAPVGGSLPHNNMQPYLALNFCIALQGVYPPRT
jgi:microcystin-dependent protein